MTQNNRTERPVQIYDKCTDCGECVEQCPEKCIAKKGEGDKTLVFDWDLCVGCGICAITCPEEDIEMVPEPEEDA
jgi:pyruvate ferredoxin oxidoreductase delta subunit